MKIISWNVNGIRSVIGKGFHDFAKKENPDVICLQEVKATREQAPIDLPEYQHIFWNSAEKKGYSGTAILSKISPISSSFGIGITEHDNEGRVCTLEFSQFYLVNVYVPNSKRALERLDYREKNWDVDFLAYLKNLETKKPVLFCGDLNVAHKEIDLANPKSNVKNAGFTPQERQGFDNIVAAGFIDTFRQFNSEPGQYTWWSNFANSRERNIGWRIDYFCVSAAAMQHIKRSWILPEVMGSDHAPVAVETDLK